MGWGYVLYSGVPSSCVFSPPNQPTTQLHEYFCIRDYERITLISSHAVLLCHPQNRQIALSHPYHCWVVTVACNEHQVWWKNASSWWYERVAYVLTEGAKGGPRRWRAKGRCPRFVTISRASQPKRSCISSPPNETHAHPLIPSSCLKNRGLRVHLILSSTYLF